jgi:hypothetical protein
MHARIQTWFPFNIQVGLNGREWLSRQMDEAGRHTSPLQRDTGNGSEAPPGRRSRQVPAEWQLGEVLRPGVQPVGQRAAGCRDNHQHGGRFPGLPAQRRRAYSGGPRTRHCWPPSPMAIFSSTAFETGTCMHSCMTPRPRLPSGGAVQQLSAANFDCCELMASLTKCLAPNRYHVTEAGRAILIAVLTSARTSVHQLNQLTMAA